MYAMYSAIPVYIYSTVGAKIMYIILLDLAQRVKGSQKIKKKTKIPRVTDDRRMEFPPTAV